MAARPPRADRSLRSGAEWARAALARFLPVEEGTMDGIEIGREAARLRADRGARATLDALRRGQPEETAAASATAADCAAASKNPLRRLDSLRRRPVSVRTRWPTLRTGVRVIRDR